MLTMNSEKLFRTVRTYADLSKESVASWQRLLRQESYKKGECFVELGEIPLKIGFVLQGLFSQDFISESGDTTIKYFFPEGRFAASVGAMLTGDPSAFSVIALEDSIVLSFDFAEFKKLTEWHREIASFYIRYMERHWIIEKEPLEISFRHETALKRYQDFLKTYPGLVKRLRKHQIASYLGITPTQLSRLLRHAE
jgi:CRP-like cAMP-binding protein